VAAWKAMTPVRWPVRAGHGEGSGRAIDAEIAPLKRLEEPPSERYSAVGACETDLLTREPQAPPRRRGMAGFSAMLPRNG